MSLIQNITPKIFPTTLILFLSFSFFFSFSQPVKQYYSNGLKQVKYYLINGKLKKAKLSLDHLSLYQSPLWPIHARYQAMVAFLMGNYEQSLNSLEMIYRKNQFATNHWTPKTCELEILNRIILSQDEKKIDDLWNHCRLIIRGINLEPSLWITALVNLYQKKSPPQLKRNLDNLNSDELVSLFKLSLYLDQSHKLLNKIPKLQDKDLADPQLREILGEVYYRNHKLINALEALRGLETPNALMIRADIAILQKKYELAYAFLQKVLTLKNYSREALERIIPLAILLDQSQALEQFLEKIGHLKGVTQQIQSLAAYNYYILKKPNLSINLLKKLERKAPLTFEEQALRAFSYFKDNSPKAYEASYRLCLKSASYCWLPIWSSYGLKRSEKREVISPLPFDQFYNLKDEGRLSSQEEKFIDSELIEDQRQFFDYMN